MRNIKLEACYVGTPFYGWQKTESGPSIESELELVLERLLQHKVVLQAASRTDRGVHAKAQIVNFFTDRDFALFTIQKALNGQLPKQIRITGIEEMSHAFHPTLDTTGKEYHYHLTLSPFQSPFERETHWHIHQDLNLTKMEQVMPYFLGEKDFSALQNDRKNPVDNTVCNLTQFSFEGDRFTLIGNRFLYKMVRNLVGTVVYVGLNKIDPDHVLDAFEKGNREELGMTAPAHGLVLHRVYYSKMD